MSPTLSTPSIITACILAGCIYASNAHAQAGMGKVSLAGEETTILFVPVLDGGTVFGLGLQSRVPLGARLFAEPGDMVEVSGGYRWYLDNVGALALGIHGYGALSLPETRVVPEPAYERYWSMGAGAHLQLRGINDQFFYALASLVLEGGILGHNDQGDPEEFLHVPDGPGFRLFAGLEAGFGGLGYLDPYIYGESGIRLGVEWMNFSGVQATSLQFSLQLRLDFAHR